MNTHHKVTRHSGRGISLRGRYVGIPCAVNESLTTNVVSVKTLQASILLTRFNMSEMEESEQLMGEYGSMSGSSVHDISRRTVSGSTATQGTELGDTSRSSEGDFLQVQVSGSGTLQLWQQRSREPRLPGPSGPSPTLHFGQYKVLPAEFHRVTRVLVAHSMYVRLSSVLYNITYIAWYAGFSARKMRSRLGRTSIGLDAQLFQWDYYKNSY